MKPSIGKTENNGDLVIDIESLIDTRLLVQSNSGGGKSWLLRRLLEQTANHVQQIVIDIEGEFATLREKFDYVICAPSGADAVATPQTATVLARRLRETRVSAILDLYELKMPERRRFVRLFLEELLDAPKAMWHPALVVVDEAHIFAPEKGEAESFAAVIDLASRGRKRGLCAVLATQRLSKLHKDAAAELLNKLVGRTSLDVDVQRASDELGMKSKKEAMPILRSLDPGEFFCFGPALSKDVTKVTVGKVETKHPKSGDRAITTPPPASAKIKALLAKLTDLPKEAAAEARSMADLKSENAKLKRELTMRGKAQPRAEIKTITVPAVGKRAYAGIREAASEMKKAMNKIVSVHKAWEHNLTETNKRIDGMCATLEKVGATRESPVQLNRMISRVVGTAIATSREKAPALVSHHAKEGETIPMGKCERAILSTLMQHGPCDKRKLALLSGYSWSGSFSNSVSALRTAAYLIGENSGVMDITDLGTSANWTQEPLPTGQALRDYWLNRFGKCEKAILQALFSHPGGLDKNELCDKAGYSYSGSFSNSLSALRTAGVLVGSNSSVMRAADELLNG